MLKITYTTPAADDYARALSLPGDGPLVIAGDNPLVQLLGKAIDTTTYAPKCVITHTDLMYIFGDGLLYGADVTTKCMHWSLSEGRCTALMHALDTVGMDWSAINEAEPEKIMATARARTTEFILRLPADARLVSMTDLVFDNGNPANPGTGSWYDHITPAMLMSGDGGPELVAQFKVLTPFSYHGGADGGRDSDAFMAIIAHMEVSVGRDVSSQPSGSRAAAIAHWLKATRPPKAMAPYVSNPAMEVERRAGGTLAARFEPLFRVDWRRAFPFMDALWPQPVDDIVIEASALADGLGITGTGEGVTPQAAVSINAKLEKLTHFAKAVDNATRGAEVLEAHARKGSDRADELTKEAASELQADALYTSLRESLEACGAEEYGKMARIMLHKDAHPAGILFLNNKFAPDRFWRERNGARIESSIQTLFNERVSKSTAGARQEWGSILPPGTGKRFVAGEFTLDFWATLKPVIVKREGKRVVELIDQRVAKQPTKAIFSDPERLRYLEKTARACVDAVLGERRDAHSFGALWATMLRLATAIDNMPAGCPPAIGLRNKLEEAAANLMQDAQDRYAVMLATPATAARRFQDFVITGHALDALNTLDGRVERVLSEIEDGLHGVSHDAALNQQFHSHLGKRARAGDWQNEHGRTSGGEQWGRQEQWQPASTWGSAVQHGIYIDSENPRIAFGRSVCTYPEAPDVKRHCVAKFAPGMQRDKWCLSPESCWSAHGANAHARLDKFPDATCKGVTAAEIDGLDWDKFEVLAAAGNRPTGRGRDGRGGKGAGAHAQRATAKGGGKGGKGGKGDRGGKGGKSGKGGKGAHGGKGGRVGFTRQ
tara:strand:- start:179 stop:2677 length:2499 start_codon:yes stop_codon:yes gene_type:complete